MSPYKASRPCPGYGPRRGSCRNLIKGKERYCPDCLPYAQAENKKYDKKRDKSPGRQWLHSTRWRKASNLHKVKYPLCVECKRHGKITPVYVTDHIIPHNGNYELFWDQSNWQSLCNFCHEEKHKGERWGK